MSPGQRGCRPPARGADDEALANQERLSDGLDGVGLFADCDGKSAQANRSTSEPATQGLQHGTIESVETAVIDVEQGEGRMCLSLIHISEPTRRTPISYAVFCLKKKKKEQPQ